MKFETWCCDYAAVAWNYDTTDQRDADQLKADRAALKAAGIHSATYRYRKDHTALGVLNADAKLADVVLHGPGSEHFDAITHRDLFIGKASTLRHTQFPGNGLFKTNGEYIWKHEQPERYAELMAGAMASGHWTINPYRDRLVPITS